MPIRLQYLVAVRLIINVVIALTEPLFPLERCYFTERVRTTWQNAFNYAVLITE